LTFNNKFKFIFYSNSNQTCLILIGVSWVKLRHAISVSNKSSKARLEIIFEHSEHAKT